MYITYELYRSSKPDEMFNAEKVEIPIENDDQLVAIDDIINKVLAVHIQNLPEIKKFGIAYVGTMKIIEIEMTDNDNLNMTEDQFRHFMSTINLFLNIPIIWSITNKDIEKEKEPDKTKAETE